MDKISKEELLRRINLSEEELEKVAGGTNKECRDACAMQLHDTSDVDMFINCIKKCK